MGRTRDGDEIRFTNLRSDSSYTSHSIAVRVLRFLSPHSSVTLVTPLRTFPLVAPLQDTLETPSHPHHFVLDLFPSFPSPPTLLNTEPHRSMDLPRSPLSSTDTHLWAFPCFTFISAPLLPCHHVFPSLASIFDPLYHHQLPFHVNSFTLCHRPSFLLIELHYDSFPMTHSFFHFIHKPLAQSMYSLSYSYSFVLTPSPIHLVPLEPSLTIRAPGP